MNKKLNLKKLNSKLKNKPHQPNRKGKVILEILILMITVVITSATVLLLIKSGVLSVRADSEVPGEKNGAENNILNTEFIPFGREGSLAVNDFKFCGYVNEQYNCLNEGNEFFLGSEVYFWFVAESSTYNGEIMLVENYRIKGPDGKLLLDVDAKNNYNFGLKSKESTELMTFKDFFTVNQDQPEGNYTLELFLENPLLNKKVTLIKTFKLLPLTALDNSQSLTEEDFWNEAEE